MINSVENYYKIIIIILIVYPLYLMTMHFQYKNWFTVIEILIILVFISVWIISLYSVISWAVSFTTTTKQRIIWINIAREWMESVFNIRDTNWQRRSGKKDQCWLKTNPMIDEWSAGCENDQWMKTGNYKLLELKSWDQTYLSLSGNAQLLDLKNKKWYTYKMCTDNKYWFNCTWSTNSNITDMAWAYYRVIIWKWLLNKMTNTYIVCNAWNHLNCGKSDSKEYIFCSRVEYSWNWIWNVEFCSSITNFVE